MEGGHSTRDPTHPPELGLEVTHADPEPVDVEGPPRADEARGPKSGPMVTQSRSQRSMPVASE
eukprot:9526949-Alexandrium_andersonii.AAC.1